jgi:hypothetical protein
MKEIADPPNSQSLLMEPPSIDKTYTVNDNINPSGVNFLDAIVLLNVPTDNNADKNKKNLCALNSIEQDCKKVSITFSEYKQDEAFYTPETEPLYSSSNSNAVVLSQKYSKQDDWVNFMYQIYLSQCGDQIQNPNITLCNAFEDLIYKELSIRDGIKNDIALLLKTDGSESFLFFRNVYIRSDKNRMPIRYEFCALLPKLFAKLDIYCTLFKEIV